MNDLRTLARQALRNMPMPEKERSLYPSIHKAANAIDWPSRTEALREVFLLVCEAVGVRYGSQYMSDVINARFRDGSLQRLLREVTA